MVPYGMLFGWLIADFFKPEKKSKVTEDSK
jgi:hypothetical protein